MKRRSRPSMRTVIDRREVKTETGHYCIERLSCGHEVTVFPQVHNLDSDRRNCKECQNGAKAKAHYLDSLEHKKPGKLPKRQCAHCQRRARWPYKLCKYCLGEARLRKGQAGETVQCLRQAADTFEDISKKAGSASALIRRALEGLERASVAIPGSILCAECMAEAIPGKARCSRHLAMLRKSAKRHRARRAA